MYIDNPKRLFKDLKNIDTISAYMQTVEDDGMQNDLSNLISIVEDNLDKAESGDSATWSVEDLTNQEIEQLKEDHFKLMRIKEILRRERKSKYRIVCQDCGDSWYFLRKPKYSHYICPTCVGSMILEKVR